MGFKPQYCIAPTLHYSIPSPSPWLGDHVHYCGLAALDDLNRLVQGRSDLIGLSDRAEAVDVKSARDRRQIRRRLFDANTDAFVRYGPVAPARHAFLMFFVVVIGTVVEYDDQQRNLIFRRSPERIRSHQEIAIADNAHA